MEREKRSSYFFITINKGAKCYNNFVSILNELYYNFNYIEYSYIYHNEIEKDDTDEQGHIHLVLYFKNSVRSLTTLKKIFEGSHIELTNRQRYKRCIQYLIHKNEINKHQYNINEIVTNINQVDLLDIIHSIGYDFEQFNANLLQDYMQQCLSSSMPNIYYFITRFGIDTIKPYYFIIKDLLNYERTLRQDEIYQLANEQDISNTGVIF